ncbi:PEP-CTERM sorting domain-containing protein [Thalassoglobus sp. JC818]|uniref:PEP-CTERM sorting domain-containing protein n=1 Tax=Thalassoglobus sp. JC818 TaxID=3232136 RepID=UPI0034595AA3
MKTAVALFVVATLSRHVEAGVQYSMVHNSDAYATTGPIDVIGPRSTPINYEFAGFTDFRERNHGEVQVNVNQGSIGIHAETYNNGLYAPQRQEVTAKFQFDTIFSSTGSSPVDVIMNLDLSGTIDPGQSLTSSIQVDAGSQFTFSRGTYSESLNPSNPPVLRDGMLSGFSASGNVQSVSTGAIQVPVNVPVTMFFSLTTSQGYDLTRSTIDFGSTFNLTRFGDVFTIQGPNASEVYSVDSIDAGIVNNRFQSKVVPEPSSFALIGLGSFSFLSYVRKRQRPLKLVRPAG